MPTAFRFTGDVQTYTVPAGVRELIVAVRGGAADFYWSAIGFTVRIPVTPGEELEVYVGGRPAIEGFEGGSYQMATTGAWPDGGDGGGGAAAPGPDWGGSLPWVGTGGAGSTSVRRGGVPVVVAGGAGGGPYNGWVFETYDPTGEVRTLSYNTGGPYAAPVASVRDFVRFLGEDRPGPGEGFRAPRDISVDDPTWSGDGSRVFEATLGNPGELWKGGDGILVGDVGTGGGGGGYGGGGSGSYYHAAGTIGTGTDGFGHPLDDFPTFPGPGDPIGSFDLKMGDGGRPGVSLIPLAEGSPNYYPGFPAGGAEAGWEPYTDEELAFGGELDDPTATLFGMGALAVEPVPTSSRGWNVGSVGMG